MAMIQLEIDDEAWETVCATVRVGMPVGYTPEKLCSDLIEAHMRREKTILQIAEWPGSPDYSNFGNDRKEP